MEPALGTQKGKNLHLSSYAHVVHTTAKQAISRGRKKENVFKMSKDEKCTCKACKNTVFHCQICKFVGFLLPSSSWLLMYQSNRSLNIPPGIPRAFDELSLPGGGEFDHCSHGVGNLIASLDFTFRVALIPRGVIRSDKSWRSQLMISKLKIFDL